MGPAMGWIDNYFDESRTLAASTAVVDPCVGRLLAFGNVLMGKQTRIRKIVGFATGPSRSDLALAEVPEREYSFGPGERAGLLVPQIVNADAPPAHQFPTPIRQICFSGNPYHEETLCNRMAVRTAQSTFVFKQAWERVAGSPANVTLKSSAIILPSSREADHADVAFNPFFDSQFAIIDQRSHWTVTELGIAQFGINTLRKTSVVAEGDLAQETDGSQDGWGRISWGSGINSVMVCNRRRAAIFDIREKSSAGSAIEVPAERDRSLNLDLHRGLKGNDAFLLTSVNLMWLDLRQTARPVLSIPHRRHLDDTSLTLELFKNNDGVSQHVITSRLFLTVLVTTAMIQSRMNFLTTCYQLSTDEDEQHPVFLDTPYQLSPPYSPQDPSEAPAGISVLPCAYPSVMDDDSLGAEYLDAGVSFFSGFALDGKLGITQRLYSTKQDATSPSKLDRKKFEKPIRSAGFVDESDSEEDERQRRVSVQPRPTRLKNSSHRRVDFSELYDFAFNQGQETLRTVTDADTDYSVDRFCETTLELLTKRIELGALQVSSLLDVRTPVLLFQDLPALETAIRALLADPQIQEHYDIRPLQPTSADGFTPVSTDADPAATSFSIQQLYERLIDMRLRPLPAHVPARYRIRQEQLCRLIATETFLASMGINIKPRPEDLAPPPPTQPVVPSSSPLPSDLATTNGEEESQKEPLERLRAYTPVQSRVTLPKGFQHVLDGWQLGANPHTAEYAIDPDQGVPRYKVQRRRLRKEKERRAGVGVVGSQPPVLIAGSQVVGLGPGVVSSQVDPSQVSGKVGLGVMSQVERGPHGGRPAGKPKKKRRTGF